MASCLFCGIIDGTVPSTKVFEDADALAFVDVRPQAPIHLLIVPKAHVARLDDATTAQEPLLGRLTRIAADLARRQGLSERGYRLVINSGPDGGQTVSHLHLHLLGGRAMQWPPG